MKPEFSFFSFLLGLALGTIIMVAAVRFSFDGVTKSEWTEAEKMCSAMGGVGNVMDTDGRYVIGNCADGTKVTRKIQ